MKPLKSFLHALIVLASLAGLLVGWGTLAHSRKPVSSNPPATTDSIALPTLAPLQSYGSGSNFGGLQLNMNGLQPLSPQTRRPRGSSVLRTGGS